MSVMIPVGWLDTPTFPASELAWHVENFDTLPPIRVRAGVERYWIVDGWHRVAAAWALDRTYIRAIIEP
jgi:ParB-like chromosome segregation protein Spo0J